MRRINCGTYVYKDIVNFQVYAEIKLVKYIHNPLPVFYVSVDVYLDGKRHSHGYGKPYFEYILNSEKGAELKDIIALYDCYITGEPCNSVSWGYLLLHDRPERYSEEKIARHFRIPVEKVSSLRNLTIEQIKDFVDEHKNRWEKEAKAVIEKYALEVEYPEY